MFDYVIGKMILTPIMETTLTKCNKMCTEKFDSRLPLAIQMEIEKEARKISWGYLLIGIGLVSMLLFGFAGWATEGETIISMVTESIFYYVPFLALGYLIRLKGKKGIKKIEDYLLNSN